MYTHVYTSVKTKMLPHFYIVDIVVEIFPVVHRMVYWTFLPVQYMKCDRPGSFGQSKCANQIMHATFCI